MITDFVFIQFRINSHEFMKKGLAAAERQA
jgi:hypothetical protein